MPTINWVDAPFPCQGFAVLSGGQLCLSRQNVILKAKQTGYIGKIYVLVCGGVDFVWGAVNVQLLLAEIPTAAGSGC